MTVSQAVATVVLSAVVPYVVQAIKTQAMGGEAARWLAIAASVLAGIVTGFVGGVPADPGAWVTAVFATIGGVQLAYSAFRAVGVTSRWLDALMGVRPGAEGGK